MHLQDKKGEINLNYFLMRVFGIHRKPADGSGLVVFLFFFKNNVGLFVKCSACAIGLNSVQSKKKVYRGKTFSHVYISLKTLNES